MQRLSPLENTIQHYAWGSRTALAELQGRPAPTAQPEAELWMGAHPLAPSRVRTARGPLTLDALIRSDPEGLLGSRVEARFAGDLPFLLKVLAVERPLSLQAHPTRQQAEAGFAREETLGIPGDAPQRSYRDRHHKPEMVCALTPFRGLVGFRPATDVLCDFEALAPTGLAAEIGLLRAEPGPEGWRRAFQSLLAAPRPRMAQALREACGRAPTGPPRFDWLRRLAAFHPDDPGALAPLYLHLVQLAPGEAVFLAARELHCYLEGVAVEIMASSDNVLRGGLTPKHVDAAELLRVLRFEPATPRLLRPGARGKAVLAYPVRAEEFALDAVLLRAGSPLALRSDGPEILLCVEGSASVRDAGSENLVALGRGGSVLAPARVTDYTLEGEGRLFRARVPSETEWAGRDAA